MQELTSTSLNSVNVNLSSIHMGWGRYGMYILAKPKSAILTSHRLAHKHIVWLQVPVNDGVSVEEVKSAEQLTHYILYKEKGRTHEHML